jgi:hypothetical protein
MLYMSIQLPKEVWNLIYSFDPTYHRFTLKQIHHELMNNCAIRCLREDGHTDYESQHVYHKGIHSLYSDDKFWQTLGWCSIKCGSVNWPHSCDFCPACGRGKEWCSCNPQYT